MTVLRQRIYRVTVGTIRVGAPAHVAFEIERGVSAQPNKTTVKLWNLSLSHQRQIEQSADQQVIIEVGHESTDRGLERIFQGRVFRAPGRGSRDAQPTLRTEVAALDVVTHVEARDAGREYQQRRTARSFAPGASPATVLRGLVEDIGVGEGNLNEAITVATSSGITFDEGLVVSGQAARELTQILRGVGLRWSVQHGAFQALRGATPLQVQAVRLAPSTGLIGSPEPGTRGRVKAHAILTSDIWPGRAIVLESARTSGTFTVRSMKSTGDSHTNDWQSELQLEAVA